MGMFDNRKAWIYSAVGHGLILAVSLLAFVVTPHAVTPPDSVAIDIISSDDLAHITKGIESGRKEIKTPLAEKIDEPKKIDDTVGKMKVSTVLESLPGVGKVKARKLMEELDISATRRVRGLGAKQKANLLDQFAKK